MPANQFFDQSIRRATQIEGVKAEHTAGFLVVIHALLTFIKKKLLNREVAQLNQAEFNSLLADIRGFIRTRLGQYTDKLKAMLARLAKDNYHFEVKSLNKAFGLNLTAKEVDLLSVIEKTPMSVKGADGKLLPKMISDFVDTQSDRIVNHIRLARLEDKSNAQIAQSIEGTKSRRNQDGILSTLANNAVAVIGAIIGHVINQTKRLVAKHFSNAVIGEKMVAILDSKTSAFCRNIHGKIFPVGVGRRPPFHYHCRTTVVLVTKHNQDHAGEDSYYDWLQRQPDNFQDEVLGKTRGKLFRDGGLSTQAFADLNLNKNFKPMTLDEMKAKEPLAFERAGL